MQTKILPPKIEVYYIKPVQPPVLPYRIVVRRFFIPVLLFVAILLGVGGGIWLNWTSRFGQANQAAQISPNPQIITQQKSAAIPLQFDQSDLNIIADLLPILIEQNRHEPTVEEIQAAQRKDQLKEYLSGQKSPLAEDDSALNALLRSRNMKMILAISFVESNMCKKSVGHNCSGIGGSQIKKYPGFANWIDDFDNLLEKRYKDLPVEKFIGYYVQPGSQNWIDGVYQILGDLSERHIE